MQILWSDPDAACFCCSMYHRLMDVDDTSKCVQQYCLSKFISDFRACYKRCLDFAVLGMTSPTHLSLPPPKRQVDPLQSCIEAKCAGMHKGHYGSCIYRRCITGVYKTAKKRISLHDLVYESDFTKPTLLGPSGEEVPDTRPIEEQVNDILRGHGLKLSDLLPSRADHSSDRSLFLGDVLPRSTTPQKKSWNDITQNCIMYHCRDKTPGSPMYNVCVQVHCTKVQLGRRESKESGSSSEESAEN